MIKEFQSRIHVRLRSAIQIYGNADIGLRGLALHNGTTVGATQILRHITPVGSNQYTCRSKCLALEHRLTFGLRLQKDSLCSEVESKFHIRCAVTHNIRRRHIIIARKILAKHTHTGFARRRVLLGQCGVNQLIIEKDTLARKCAEHLGMCRPEGILRK